MKGLQGWLQALTGAQPKFARRLIHMADDAIGPGALGFANSCAVVRNGAGRKALRLKQVQGDDAGVVAAHACVVEH